MSSEFWTAKAGIARTAEADELDRQRKRAEGQVALIFALIIGACAALGIILSANNDDSRLPTQVSDCTGVEPTAQRLACFDTLARQSATPFKGAAPPHSDGQL